MDDDPEDDAMSSQEQHERRDNPYPVVPSH